VTARTKVAASLAVTWGLAAAWTLRPAGPAPPPTVDLAAARPGERVRVRGVVVRVERRSRAWTVFLPGVACDLADGESAADLTPGEPATIVGRVRDAAGPATHGPGVVLVDCRAE
jgi:hypothetical protein